MPRQILLHCVVAVGLFACRKSQGVILPAVVTGSATDAVAEGGSTREVRENVNEGSNDVKGSLLVHATMNGEELPEGIHCRVVVYDEGSQVSRRVAGGCDERLTLEAGTVDVDIRLATKDGREVYKRLNAERVGHDPKKIMIDFAWAMGRLRLSHKEAPEIRGCRIHVRDTELRGADSESFTLPAGTYSADIECDVSRGMVRTAVSNLTVTSGQDTVAVFQIQPNVAPSPLPPGVPSTLTTTPSQSEVPQAADPGVQSAKTEDLSVESYSGK
jgi:hypothetical protein